MPFIFLSPSTQEWNPYATSGNEEQYMNYLADRMEPFLRASGIAYDRNDSSRNVAGAISDSNAGNYDVHLALHSNAAGGSYAGKIRGVDAYYAPSSKSSQSLATIIANNIQSIYPLPNKTAAVPTTSLGEVTRTKATSVLVELGYHDNPLDEAWLKANLTPIARNLAQSLTDYFGIPFIEPTPVRSGYASTDGSGLNIRSYPSSTGAVIGSVPNGGYITIYGEYNDWYVIRYGGLTGYVSKAYVKVNK